MTAHLARTFRNLPKLFKIILVIELIVLIGVLDYVTGFEMSMSFLYLAPISIAAWELNQTAAIGASIASDLAWFVADYLTNHAFRSPSVIDLWNAATRLGIFLVYTLLLSSLRNAMDEEKRRAGTDYLTGVSNLRAFFERCGVELERARRYRHPISIAYLDLDDFKAINDRFGHNRGNEVLRALSSVLLQHIRSGDLAGRLGGDEFAVLLPETGEAEARAAGERLHEALSHEFSTNHWPVSISMGVLTCWQAPSDVTRLMIEVDSLMYEVKRNGKNNMKHKSLNQGSLD